MKLRKTHTGVYCCPDCCIEYDLSAETVLKCDECGGPLYQGALDEYEDAEPEPEPR